jgi:hypothetical protein
MDPWSGPPNGGAAGRAVTPPTRLQWWRGSILHVGARVSGVASKWCAAN